MRHVLFALATALVLFSTPACVSGGGGGDGEGGGDGCTCTIPGSSVILACGANSCVDGAGWTCADGTASASPGACSGAATCTPNCNGAVCGPDGCGGQCGACQAGENCSAGSCVPPGAPCQPTCNGAACGPDGCGGQCGQCAAGETCQSGACQGPGCVAQCAGKACGPDGCGGQCGTCAADELCTDGACAPAAQGCPANRFDCGGRCVDLLSDAEHCGSCAGRCPTQEGALAICIEAECYLSCADQSHVAADVDFNNDVDNCGRCGNKCPSVTGGEASCRGGVCEDPCDAVGLTNCGGRCVETYDDRNNCGACGEVCAAEAECEYGRCDCGPFEQHCDGQCLDDDHVDHCGQCGVVCPEVANAERECWGRECSHRCNEGFMECGEDRTCLGGSRGSCESDEDCCQSAGFVCQRGQCTAYPQCSQANECPSHLGEYDCAFDVCLRACGSSSDCPNEGDQAGVCYTRRYSSAHGFYVGTDHCYLKCSTAEDCPFDGMSCSLTNWTSGSDRMCTWN